jgi:Arm DNA-binding domain/Phage integrase central domain
LDKLLIDRCFDRKRLKTRAKSAYPVLAAVAPSIPQFPPALVHGWYTADHLTRSRKVRAKITKRAVDALPSGQTISDSEVRGFRVRRLNSGVTLYEFRYSKDGQRPCINLGHHGSITPEQARELAKKRAGEVAEGKDPAEQRHVAKTAASSTLNALLDEFLARHVRKNLRSADEIERAFRVYVRPHIGSRSIYALRRRDIVQLLDKIEDQNGPVMCDRVLAHLRKAFNWQATRDDQFNSPIVKGMARTKPKDRARKRILDDQEIRDLWEALGGLNGKALHAAAGQRQNSATQRMGER